MTKARAKPVAAKAVQVEAAPDGPQTALTTAAGQIGPFGYVAGLLLTDVPPEVIKANRLWMTADADAVSVAQAAGADSVPYRG